MGCLLSSHTDVVNIQDAFELCVLSNPEAIAIQNGTVTLSYAEVNGRANYLAAYLQSNGVEPGDFVAMSFPHGANMIVAILAILKCGAAYLPVSTSNPVAVNQSNLAQAGVKVMLVENGNPAYANGLTVISVEQSPEYFSSELHDFTHYQNHADDKAYIMFTSGSTGKPKGVVVPHRAIMRLVLKTNFVDIASRDNVLQMAPASFDAATFEIWAPLLNGATLVPYSGLGLDPNRLKSDISDNNVTVMWLTAALFHLIAENAIEAFSPLKVLIAGGDVINPKYVNKVLDNFPNITVVNGYGPTENTTFTCCHVMTTANRPDGPVPIGRGISGTSTFVLDDNGKPVAEGEVGELIAGGLGVALGYLNKPLDDGPFFLDNCLDEGLLYRTGDLVRCNQNGEFEFIGRQDNQVKVRGFRVSLEEIKNAIAQVSGVADALVTVQKFQGGDQLLTAYVKADPEIVTLPVLRKTLARELANYMIPDKFIVSSNLPINANGKLDKKALLESA